MTYWRALGLTYLQFSIISSRVTRCALKGDKKVALESRGASQGPTLKKNLPVVTAGIKT